MRNKFDFVEKAIILRAIGTMLICSTLVICSEGTVTKINVVNIYDRHPTIELDRDGGRYSIVIPSDRQIYVAEGCVETNFKEISGLKKMEINTTNPDYDYDIIENRPAELFYRIQETIIVISGLEIKNHFNVSNSELTKNGISDEELYLSFNAYKPKFYKILNNKVQFEIVVEIKPCEMDQRLVELMKLERTIYTGKITQRFFVEKQNNHITLLKIIEDQK